MIYENNSKKNYVKFVKQMMKDISYQSIKEIFLIRISNSFEVVYMYAFENLPVVNLVFGDYGYDDCLFDTFNLRI